jgi:TolB-like protein
MAESPGGSHHTRFADFEIDLRAGQLRHNGDKIKLGERPLQVLAALLEHPGEVVTREELQRKIWPADTFVDFEHSINTAVNKLREALGDSAEKPRFIETLPRHGYRFIAHPEAGRARQNSSVPKIESIAVLPLENLSNDAEQEFFADAMTEELITNLGKAGVLRVISRTSVVRYKRTTKPLPEIALELNVYALVEGTVLRSGNRVRITANLLHAPTDRHLWAERYERDLKDTLAVQSDVTSDIAYQILARLTGRSDSGARGAQLRAVNPGAYEAYLKGRYYTHKLTREGFQKSNEYLTRAIEADPDYAPAYAAIADNCALFSIMPGLARHALYEKGRQSAERALHLDPSLAEAHAALANIAFHFDWDWALAEREFRQALQLNPNLVTARESYAEFLLRVGRADECILQSKCAVELDPLSLLANTQLAWAYGNARRFDQSIAQLQQVLELEPNFLVARFNLGEAYTLTGRHEEAIQELLLATAADPNNWFFQTYLGYAYGRAGKSPEALSILEQLEDGYRTGTVSPFALGIVQLGLNRHDEALCFLEEAYQQHEPWLITLKTSPELDPLRPDSRFKDLLRRMNFPP